MEEKRTIWTIGHSTRPIDEFLSLLKIFQIEQLIDIRRFPGSKRFPQYNKETIQDTLSDHDVTYVHLEGLGGRRNPLPGSINTAWRVKGFRGYADYMGTAPFIKAINELESIALSNRKAFMCTEAVWWSCHRSLVADYLKVRGWKVFHILTSHNELEHPYTKAATIIDGTLRYDK